MNRITTTIPFLLALYGCATPPAQVRTVYVPEPATARVERNLDCHLTIKKAQVLTSITLKEIKGCERDPIASSDGCLRMFAVLKIAETDGVLNAAHVCLQDMNAPGISMEELASFGEKAGEIGRRLDRLMPKLK